MFHGETHYKLAMFNSYVSHYQRVFHPWRNLQTPIVQVSSTVHSHLCCSMGLVLVIRQRRKLTNMDGELETIDTLW